MAQGVLDVQVFAEVVFKRKSSDIGAGFAEITIFQAVEIAAVATVVRLVRAVCGMGFAHRETVRNTRVRQVVTFHVVVIDVDPGIGAQAKRQGRSNTPAVVIDIVATGHIAFVAHQVQTTGNGIAELIVTVQGIALGLIRAPGVAAIKRITQMGFLADHVDGAAGCTATAEGRVRAFGDFNRFYGENLASLGAGIAYAIQIGVALGVKAANERPVALRVTAFTCAEGNAWNGAQCVLQGSCGRILDQLLRDHGDRAGRINQGRGVLRGVGFFNLVGLLVLLA